MMCCAYWQAHAHAKRQPHIEVNLCVLLVKGVNDVIGSALKLELLQRRAEWKPKKKNSTRPPSLKSGDATEAGGRGGGFRQSASLDADMTSICNRIHK